MITIYWFRNGVRVVQGEHPEPGAYEAEHNGPVVTKTFCGLDEALKQLKRTNRAYGTVLYMKEQNELAEANA